MKKQHFIFFLLIMNCLSAFSNNLKITNPQQIDNNTISCEVSWENAWKTSEAPFNHDAIWIFIKAKQSNNLWKHCNIETAFSMGNIIEIETVSDKKGFFVKPAQEGKQNIYSTEIRFKLNENIAGKEISIFGIEMVYIPEGSFYVGDGASINTLQRGDGTFSFLVENQNEIVLGNQQNQISGTTTNAPEGNIPTSYPNGFGSFYCMKYEITQEQYVDFLNTLSYTQQEARTTNSPNSAINTLAMTNTTQNRNSIVVKTSGTSPSISAIYACNDNYDNNFDAENDAQNRATNWLNWADLSAYLDWAALRPMTELEFEKVCRGASQNAIAGEFAWGTDKVTDANTLINNGTNQESVSDEITENSGLANHGYVGLDGTLRNGFAAKENTNRLQAGMSYYGVAEMSGNVWEIVIGLNTAALVFDGKNGDGEISTNGQANVSNWTDNQTAEGATYKGGAWSSGIYNVGSFRDLAISDRYYIYLKAEERRNTSGGRGVR